MACDLGERCAAVKIAGPDVFRNKKRFLLTREKSI